MSRCIIKEPSQLGARDFPARVGGHRAGAPFSQLLAGAAYGHTSRVVDTPAVSWTGRSNATRQVGSGKAVE